MSEFYGDNWTDDEQDVVENNEKIYVEENKKQNNAKQQSSKPFKIVETNFKNEKINYDNNTKSNL